MRPCVKSLVCVVLALVWLGASTATAEPEAKAPAATASSAASAAPTKAGAAPAVPAAASTVAATSDALPVIEGEPKTFDEALPLAKQAIEYGKAKNWFGLAALCTFFLMFLLKAEPIALFRRFGKRWAYIILPVLGVAAMLLTRFVGGLSWETAVTVLTSPAATGLLVDFVQRGLLAREPTTAMKPASSQAGSVLGSSDASKPS